MDELATFRDNYPDQPLKEIAERAVVFITYPPHISSLFQVFDVLFFGRLKFTQKYILAA
jgi:hypothetical protein